eukprot:TRINITY_DN13324_c0_g1_i2.p1 TRINITY_DN13324_c0_g1~~TRINITY_DN13324_c0_g1_i2.p1  ORF type:complete len:353 (+),score=85.59 TRINITY_DN13324_c0_g1_i2:162-1220(+)
MAFRMAQFVGRALQRTVRAPACVSFPQGSLRSLCSVPNSGMGGVSTTSSLDELVKQAESPQEASQMLAEFPSELLEELSDELSSVADPVATLNVMVSTWADQEVDSELFAEGASGLLHQVGDEVSPEDMEDSIDAALDELDIVFDDEDMLDEVDVTDEDEDEANPLARAPAPSDWRRLQATLDAETPKGEEPVENLQHPWFKTQRLDVGAKLPMANQAGTDPLKNVFGMAVEAPPRHHQSSSPPLRLFPGHQLKLTDVNPSRFKKPPYRPNYNRSNRLVRKRHCPFETGKVQMPDHKHVGTISRFVSEGGKILPRRRTGISAKNQRKFARVVKRSRHFGLIPTTSRLQRPQM